MRRFLAFFFGFILIFNTAGCAEDAAPVSDTAVAETAAGAVRLERAALEAFVEEAAQTYGAAGIQVAVIDNGAITLCYSCGWATKQTDPMTTDHKIRVASVSKVVIGMAAMLLQQDGMLQLDDPVGAYWNANACNPYYPETPVTIRSILTHTSSIMAYADDQSADYYNIRQRLTSGYSNTKPGDLSSYYYNNYAFKVLGATLELAANTHMDDLLQDRLFEALDIDASFASGDVAHTDLLATLYRANGEVAQTVAALKNVRMSRNPGSNGAHFAGGLTISAYDLAKLVAVLATGGVYDGQRYMDSASVRQMQEYLTPAVEDGYYQAQPLCYATDLYGRTGIYFHPGFAYGVCSCISYDPATGDGVVVLTTGAEPTKDRYDIAGICDRINAYVFAHIA